MKFTKYYKRTLFSEQVIRNLISQMEKVSGEKIRPGNLAIYRSDHEWNMDNLDDFFIEYNNGFSRILITCDFGGKFNLHMKVSVPDYYFEIQIGALDRNQINHMVSLLDNSQNNCIIDKIYNSHKKPSIFIGHGRNRDWKDLRDHLRDKHNYELKFYESDDRSSGYLFDNVNSMIDSTKISILVLSNDDNLSDGTMRARQNVIHELGLSQAIQGQRYTLVVVEEGCDWPSNIQGIDIFPYEKSIKEIYGDVVAALEKRMFDLFSKK